MSAVQHFRLGLFILGAIGTLIVILVVMGTGNLLRPTIEMETYIDGSVQGLDVGAPIKFRGVTIGEVTRLGFTSVAYEQQVSPVERKRYVLVEGRLRPDRFASTTRETLFSENVLEPFIESGLRVRMAAQGITGINYLELDFLDPATHPLLPIAWEPHGVYIPSAPSIALQFLEYAENVLRRIDLLDIEGMVDGTISALHALERTVADLDTRALTRHAEDLAGHLRATVEQSRQVLVAAERLLQDPDVAALPGETRSTLRSLREAVERADIGSLAAQIEAVVARLDRGLDSNEQKLEATLSDLQAVTTGLRSLTEDARRNPAGTIFGGPPPRSAIERSP
ncbi:Mammalian cell entry related domain protein [Thioalkalivibrio nitratireducens DSM 14787]|uniref:Mammalian cell entry related domain protein n=1 Tax=Thioalkalivibrio nitratireducens (strain DSM 14787 / UNIQEM 213 / ALEN2) TaxID=1255043 RepID=L0DV80_THIND|nr:MlaD family protein [Thioalkalivibrio nitratireducens]AGA32907.1 Mammalian cell entry related domain protein [Thioalkalivibrio nitratireducens DSM 14787]